MAAKTILSYLLLPACIFFAACRKKDSTPPVLSLKGDKYMAIPLNSAWVEPGYTAEDDTEGDMTESVEIYGSVNPDFAGIYYLTYTATDRYGNETSLIRSVTVFNEAKGLDNEYSASDTCALSPTVSYTASITPSNYTNKEFFLENFGGWNSKCICITAVKLIASGLVAGSPLSWPGQVIAGNDSLIASSGGGAILSMSPVSFSLTYQWTNGTTTQTCSAVYIQQ